MTPWTGALQIFCCMPCRHRPWPCGWISGARRIPWPVGFPQMRLPSWDEHSSSWISGPQKQWLYRIFRGLYPQWLGGWSLVGQITYDKFKVMEPGLVSKGFLMDPPDHLPLVIHGLLWELSNRQAKQGGIFLTLLSLLGIRPLLETWWGILRSNVSYCGVKLGSTPNTITKGPQLTTAWPYTPLWARLLPHTCPPPTSWWVVGMGFRLELGGLFLPLGSRLGAKFVFTMCLPRRLC